MLYNELRAFHAVASLGSFTAAADALAVTQPTMSNQVKALEERYGVVLLERRWRKVEPTDLGAQLLDLCRRILALQDEAEELLSSHAKLQQGRLRLGSDSPITTVPMMARYNGQYPGIRLSLSVGNLETLIEALFAFDIDLAVVANIEPDRRLKTMAIRRDPVTFFVGAAHRWAGQGPRPIAALADETLVLREPGSMSRQAIERAMAKSGITPKAVIEVTSREASREVAALGLGIGVMSAADFVPEPRLVRVPIADASSDIELTEYLVCLADRAERRLIRSFLEMMRSPQK